MFSETYPARYRDSFGEVATTIHNDGKQLRMTLRGVEFFGTMLDDWEPVASTDALQLQQFAFNHTDLCDFVLEFTMPLPLLFHTERVQGTLHIQLTLGAPAPNGGNDREILLLTLHVMTFSFSSLGKSGYFEDELLELARQFPQEMSMQICFGCALSDYSPYGNGLFGNLACFRDNKQQYLAVQTKYELFDIWDTHTEYVQETYHCGEFEQRKPGAGYSG